MNNLFSQVRIVDKNGFEHKGIQPSLLEKPFREVAIHTKDGKTLLPYINPTKTNIGIIGFDMSVKVIADAMGSAETANYFYRLVTLYRDGERFSAFYTMDGQFVGTDVDY